MSNLSRKTRLAVAVDSLSRGALEVISHMLHQIGIEARTATTGDEGWKLIAKLKPDIVILDPSFLHFSRSDDGGFEFMSRLKSEPVLSAIPIMVFTARGEVEFFDRCFECGAADYLAKTGYHQFTARVNRALGVAVQPGVLPRRVVCVNDDWAMLYLLTVMLKRAGFEVVRISDGLTALKVIENVKPDLVLLDIMMPEIDGIEVLRRLKANPNVRHVPVIIMNPIIERWREQATREGAAFCLDMPFLHTQLLDAVNSVLGTDSE